MDQETLALLLTKISVDVADLKKGLQESRNDLQGLKTMAQGVGESVKKALAFTGITIGIYELAGALKSFAKDAVMVGAKTETLDIAMKQVGKTYGVTADSLKYYVDELKAAGITTQEAQVGITKFLTSGLPLDQIKALAIRARDIAVVAGVNTSEAFNRIIQGIITGEQETLRRLMIQVGHTDQIFERHAATLGKTKDQLNSVEKAQAMLNEVMRLSAGFAGVAAEADSTVGKQLASMARYAEEAKNALWSLFGPIMLAIIQQLTLGWKELKTWADENEASLREWGSSIADLIHWIVGLVAAIGKFLIEHKELAVALMEFKLFSLAAGWVLALGTAATKAATGLKALATGVTTVKIAMGGWLGVLLQIVAALAAYGAYQTIKRPTALDQMSSEEAQLLGEGWVLKGPTPAKALPIPGSEGEGHVGIESPAERKARADREAKAAFDKASRAAPTPTGKGKKGKGTEEDLFGDYLKLLDQQRQAEIEKAQDSLDLLRATNEKKKAELEKAMAEGLMDGQAYYQRLRDLQQEETAAALALIAKKRQAQEQAYQDALADINRLEISPEVAETRRQAEAAKNRMVLAQLDAEAARVRLEGEVKITNELKRQVEVKKEYQQKTEDLNLETAQILGMISEQEAKLQRLYLDWQRAKQEAIKAGAPPEYFQALEANFRAKSLDAGPWGQKLQSSSQIFVNAFADLANTLWEGGVKISQALDALGKKILQDTFKLFFDDLGKAISQGIKSLANSIAQELQSSWGGGWSGGFFSGIGNWQKGLFGGGGGGGSIDLGATYGYSGWFAHGAAFSHGLRLAAFGRGGIVTRPTLFPMAYGMGLMGEEGEEGVFPLERIGGDLGVKALLPKSGPPQVQVINNLGVEAKPTVQQDDQGGLRITLERAVARMITDGGLVQQALLATLNVGKRF